MPSACFFLPALSLPGVFLCPSSHPCCLPARPGLFPCLLPLHLFSPQSISLSPSLSPIFHGFSSVARARPVSCFHSFPLFFLFPCSTTYIWKSKTCLVLRLHIESGLMLLVVNLKSRRSEMFFPFFLKKKNSLQKGGTFKISSSMKLLWANQCSQDKKSRLLISL